jgi:uncharacterized membrane protein YtjA (UPF0391 family)
VRDRRPPGLAWGLLYAARKRKARTVLRASIVFFIIGLISMVLGASDLAGITFEAGKLLLWVFLLLSLISFIAGSIRGEVTHVLPEHSDR